MAQIVGFSFADSRKNGSPGPKVLLLQQGYGGSGRGFAVRVQNGPADDAERQQFELEVFQFLPCFQGDRRRGSARFSRTVVSAQITVADTLEAVLSRR